MNASTRPHTPGGRKWLLGSLVLGGALVVLLITAKLRPPAEVERRHVEVSSTLPIPVSEETKPSLEPPGLIEQRQASASNGGSGTPAVSAQQGLVESSVTGTDFSKKYQGFTKERLTETLAVMREKRFALQKRILEDREKAGLFTKVPVEPGQSYNFAEMARTEGDRLYPESKTRFATHVRGGNNQGYVEISSIPPGNYPDFDALQNEELWLHARLRQPFAD